MSESPEDGQPEGNGQPRSSGQSASGSQPTSGGQPASGSQPRSSGQPASGSQPRSSGQPVGGSQPRSGGQPAGGGQPVGGGQPRTNGQSGGGNRARQANDPIADLQRWLMRAGARSMANQVADQVRRTVGQERRDRGDVWDTATNEPPPEESPECQWCPICQAARAARLSGPGLISTAADVGGALAAMAQDALTAFEQIIKTQEQNRSAERTGAQPPAPPAQPSAPPAQPPSPPAQPRRPPETTEPTS